MGTSTRAGWRPVLLIGCPVVLLVGLLLPIPGPSKFLATTLFVFACPGLAVLSMAGFRLDPSVECLVAAVIGWSLATLGSLVLAYTKFWHPWLVVAALAMLSIVGGARSLAHEDRR